MIEPFSVCKQRLKVSNTPIIAKSSLFLNKILPISLNCTLMPVCCSISLSSGTFHTVTPIVKIKTIMQITSKKKIPTEQQPLPKISPSLCIKNKPNVPTVKAAKLAKNLGITDTSSRSLGLCVKFGSQDQYGISIIV